MSHRDLHLFVIVLRRFLAGAFLAVAVGALGACNTTEGAGEDIEALGESIQEAAD